MRYKCTNCFRIWPESKLGIDPLRSQTRTCPNCEWPCVPVDSKTFVPGIPSIEVPELTDSMRKALIALGMGKKGHRASIRALQRRGLVSEDGLTDKGWKIFNQIKGGIDEG